MRQTIRSVRIVDQPFEAAVAELQRQTPVPIQIEWGEPGDTEIDRAARVSVQADDISLRQAFDLLLTSLEPGIIRVQILDDYDRILVTAGPVAACLRAYDVTDLVHGQQLDRMPDPRSFRFRKLLPPDTGSGLFLGRPLPTDPADLRRDKLVELIKELLDPDSWRDEGGSIGEISTLGDHLVVVHNASVLASIEELLDAIRIDRRGPNEPPGVGKP